MRTPPTTRRDFLSLSLAAGAGLALGAVPRVARAQRPGSGAPLRILILGGTGFLGPACIDACKARGHSVTLFNRGRTEKRKPGQFEHEDKIHGNRDPDKFAGTKFVDGKEVDDDTTTKGLAELAQAVKDGRAWDAVIDNSGYYPRHVRASVELLAPAVKHYVFTSTVSVYAANDKPGEDESGTLATIPDPTVETMGADLANYGPLKALCEQAAEKAMPGRVTNIRPGYIVGPNDTSDRFTYWPLRAKRGGEILAPGSESDPVQIIDVRDLAEFMVRCVENRVFGVFNATGPAKEMTAKDVVASCIAAAGSDATATFVPYEFLGEKGQPAGSLPILLPPEGETAGFHRRSVAKAVAAGLTFRPTRDTARAILDWWPGELERRVSVTKKMMDDAEKAGRPKPQMADPTLLRAGIPPEREAELLAAWKSKKSG